MTSVAIVVDTSDVQLTVDQWTRALENPQIRRDALQELGDFFVQSMVRKTRRGLDYQGVPFTPYSDVYADFRQSRGRNTSPVDLTFSGRMLAAMDSTVRADNTIVIFFNVAERGQIAWYHNATLEDDPRPRTKIPLRRFVDIDPDSPEVAAAGKVLAAAIARSLEELG